MKQRQTVPKPLAIAILAILFICIALISLQGCKSLTPAEIYAKEHQDKSWGHYQETWMDIEIDQAKAIRDQKEQIAKDSTERAKHRAKIARIKQ